MQENIFNQLIHPITAERKIYNSDQMGGQTETGAEKIQLWAHIRSIKAHQKYKFFPKGLKASAFPAALFGEAYEIIVRDGVDLSKINRIFWEKKILMVITAPQAFSTKGYVVFHAVTWTHREN